VPNIGPIETAILLLFFLGAAYLVGRHARRKGYSFALFFLLFLIVWPVALIVALALPPRHAPASPAA
jgi:cell division protein FtsW (lipid II flippase)